MTLGVSMSRDLIVAKDGNFMLKFALQMFRYELIVICRSGS